MFKRLIIGVTLGFCLFLVSCVQQNSGDDILEQSKDIKGYVMTDNGDRILVTEQVEVGEKAFPQAAVYTLTHDTKIVSANGEKPLTQSDISVGTLVEVYHTGVVAESFPTQATAAKILVHTDEASNDFAKAISVSVNTLDPNITWWVMSVEKSGDQYEVQFSELSGETEPVVVKVDNEFSVIKK